MFDSISEGQFFFYFPTDTNQKNKLDKFCLSYVYKNPQYLVHTVKKKYLLPSALHDLHKRIFLEMQV